MTKQRAIVVGGGLAGLAATIAQIRAFVATQRPRAGALCHWIDVRDGKIHNYQIIAPTTWNVGPRASNGELRRGRRSCEGFPRAFDL